MTGKQWLIVGIAIVVVVGIIVVSLVSGFTALGIFSCGGGDGDNEPTTASLRQPTMSRDVDKLTAEPTDPTDNFTVADTDIYCSVVLVDAPPETSVKAQWIYLGPEGVGLGNEILYETEAKFEGSRWLSFKLTNDAWQVGYYQVTLFLNGVEQFGVPFTVE